MTNRLSIDVTAEQHKKLKAMAALQGKSIKDYVLSRTLGDDDAALKELETLLLGRLEDTAKHGPRDTSVDEIFQRAVSSTNNKNN